MIESDPDEIESFEPTPEQLKLLKRESLAPKPEEWREFTEEEYEEMRERMKKESSRLKAALYESIAERIRAKEIAFAALPGPYDPCACTSGKKYRFCCGKK